MRLFEIDGTGRNVELLHATNQKSYKEIMKGGLSAGSFLTSSEEVAEYYAEDYSSPIILGVATTTDNLLADYPSFEEPLTHFRNKYARSDEDWFELLDEGVVVSWPEDENDWHTSLEVVESVKTKNVIPPENIRVINRE